MSAVRLRNWQTGHPDAGRVVWVWWWGEGMIVAMWDGTRWLDEQGRIVREPVTHWYEAR